MEYAIIGNNFLIPETIVLAEVLNKKSGNEVAVAGGVFVSTGIKDILFLAFDSEEIEMATVSGNEMLYDIERFLECPEIT